MKKKILSLSSRYSAIEGKPSSMREASFKTYFLKRDFEFEKIEIPKNIKDLLFLFYYLIKTKNKNNYIFVTMPPFKNLWIFFIPKLKVILDIRDGWSIAQNTGYGGTTKKKPIKASITRLIERFIIHRSYLAITCTNGLQHYLQRVSGKKILLIPNGIQDEDYKLAKKLRLNKYKLNTEEIIFCCAGQFSEYGEDKIKKLCDVIIKRYPNQKLRIQLIGSDKEKNKWVGNFLKERSRGRARIEILPRMSRDDLYKTMIQANYGLTILRDPNYDWGTKIYDYIALGLPVINYFDKPNNFTKYFDACLDISFNNDTKKPEIQRSELISFALDSKVF